jgi:hypothetical protein
MEKLVADKSWPGKKPSITDIVECFVSKTSWHDYYKPTFPKVSSYPIMVKWLEGGDDAPSAFDAWGFEKSVYVFRDLIEFVNNGGDSEKLKVKRKVTGKGGVKKSVKKGEVEVDESPKRNKKHRVPS